MIGAQMIVKPGHVSLGDLERIYRERLPVSLGPGTRPAVEALPRWLARWPPGAWPFMG